MRLHIIPRRSVMAKRNPSVDDVKLMDEKSENETPTADADLGTLNPSVDDQSSEDLGGLDESADITVDLGKLPPLAKFKKFQKKGK